MAQSVGIFRKISQRPFQRAIRQKFIVQAPPVVQVPGIAAKILQDRVYKFAQRERKLPDVRWQLKRPRAFGIAAPPVFQQEPGFIAATRNLRKQLGRPEKRHDYRRPNRVLRLVKPARHHDVGYLAAIKMQRRQLGRERKLPGVQWRQRRQQIFGVTPPPVEEPGFIAATRSLRKQLGRQEERHDYRRPTRILRLVKLKGRHDVGYLAAIKMQRRQLSREQAVFDVRWQLGRNLEMPPAVVGRADIGWLVSQMIKRAFGHNLRR